MFITENHPEGKCVFVKCVECEATCIQGTTGQSNILRHKSWCDNKKVSPSAALLRGDVVEIAPAVSASPDVKIASLSTSDKATFDANRASGHNGNTEQEAANLRATGHSWRDINSGNHDF